MFFPAQSRATWTGVWQNVGWFKTPTGLLSDVVSYLENNCNLSVESSSITEPLVLSTSSTRTVTLKVRSLIDRADVYDLDADIRHAFYVVVNQMPDGSSIQNYTLAGQRTAQSTGAPNPNTDNPQNTDTPDQTLWEKTKQALGLDKLGAGLVGVGVGAILVVGLLVFVAVKSEVPA